MDDNLKTAQNIMFEVLIEVDKIWRRDNVFKTFNRIKNSIYS